MSQDQGPRGDRTPIIWPFTNGLAVCDCGCTEFRVGVGVGATGNNVIQVLECAACKKRMAVPFFHDGAKP